MQITAKKTPIPMKTCENILQKTYFIAEEKIQIEIIKYLELKDREHK